MSGIVELEMNEEMIIVSERGDSKCINTILISTLRSFKDDKYTKEVSVFVS
jgi:hypothetical protein